MPTPETIHQAMLDAWNARDFDTMRSMFHDDYTYMGADGEVLTGADAGMEVAQGYAAAFPDAKAELLTCFAHGDRSVAEFRVTGTHTGELMGVAATGRPIELLVCNIAEMREGKVVSEHEYFDSATMWAQLGVAPPTKE